MDDLMLPDTDMMPTQDPALMMPAMEPPPLTLLDLAARGDNIAALLAQDETSTKLDQIGQDAVRLYKLDKDSMATWLKDMQRGIDLAKLVKTEKTYPFAKAANVKYPLITTAALQFNARAYPAIVPSDQVVKVKTHGMDPQGQKAARGGRVSAHMSWQLTCQIEEWEEETDKLLVQLPIVGCVTRKVWYDPAYGRPRCRLITPGAFIVNDRVKALGDAPRVTEEMSLYPDEIATRKRSGAFRDIDYGDADSEDPSTPQDFIEQHCRLDLDNDGYEEPYIVTVHVETGKVAKIVGDFLPDDVKRGPEGVVAIHRNSYFVPYHFLPSVDGGFHGTGLGILLGDVSDTINSIINMMMDAGHMAALGGGFIGSEFRIKGGSQRFEPGEWKMTPAKGGDIRSGVVPMTFPGPDAVLFQLLGLLIEAGKDVASVKDVLMGDSGGRAQTATTTMALIEQGMAQFTAAYKRIFRSLRKEFKLLARINASTVSPEEYNQFHDLMGPNGPVMLDPRMEYGAADMDIEPVADPRSVTKMQEAAKAQIIMQLAETGMVDKGEASKRVLQAASIGDVDALAPKPDPMQQQVAMMGMKAAEADLTLKMVAIDQALADIDETRSKTMKNVADATATDATVRLDMMKTRLEAMRDGLAALIGQGSRGMAGNASGPVGSIGPAPLARPATAGLRGPVLGGQPGAGFGAGGGQAGQGPLGGFV
jgi:chaperonin GroES